MDTHEVEPEAGIEHAGYAPTNERAPRSDGHGALLPSSLLQEGMTVQLREEKLVAEKRLVQIGLVRIRRQVVRETRTVEVVVAREEMIVERLSVHSGGADDAEQAAPGRREPVLADRLRALQLGETLRLPIVEEEIIVQKRPVVTQELVIDKRLVEEVRQLWDTVRREDARITHSVDLQPGTGYEARARDDAASMVTAEVATTAGSTGSDEEAVRARRQTGEQTVPLRQEELRVRTQVVDTGTIEVRTGVVSEQQSIVVRVEHEETAVKQVPVEPRPAERGVGDGEDILAISEYGEQVSLRKRPVVTEEITVGKEVVQDVQHVNTTLAREVAQIEFRGDVRLARAERADEEHG